MAQHKIGGRTAATPNAPFERRVTELRDRLLFAADLVAPARGKYSWLEKRTGVAASKWQNLYLEKQLPTVEMLLAVVHLGPSYGKWILTGLPNFEATIKQVAGTLGEEATHNLRLLADVWRDDTPEPGSWKEWCAARHAKRPKQRDDDQED